MSALPATRRHPFQGTGQILRYNWPLYAGALLASAAGSAALAWLPLPDALKGPVALGILGAIYFTAASLFASWWVYDHSRLYRWDWIAELFPVPPGRWANIHAGLDETSPDLCRLFPAGEPVIFDIYDPQAMTEPSIKRARAQGQNVLPSVSADPARLPLADTRLETAFLIFAAHEIRDAGLRLRFFRELHRVLVPGGRVLLVEHVRDAANFAAFGPGYRHFMPRSEWIRLAHEGGFAVSVERTITPFVRVWLLEKQ